MADIFKFQKDNKCCSYCQLVNEYFTYIMEADSANEAHNLLHELVSKVKDMAYLDGYRKCLIDDVKAKLNTLNCIDGECDCGECDYN